MPSAAVVTGGPPAEVWQSPGHAIALEGGSIHITCSSRGPLLGIYLKRVLPKASNVIYYEEGREATVDERFRGRVTFSGLQHNLTISVHRLQLPDTGAYACQAIMDSEVWGPGTLVVVTGREGAPPRPTWPCLGLFPLRLLRLCLPAGAHRLQEASWIPPHTHTPEPLPEPPRLSGTPRLPSASLCPFFPDKLPQAANSCREAQWTHMALSAALAAVCFLAGLGLGAVCARRGTQVSVASDVIHQPAPLREQGGTGRGAQGAGGVGKPSAPPRPPPSLGSWACAQQGPRWEEPKN